MKVNQTNRNAGDVLNVVASDPPVRCAECGSGDVTVEMRVGKDRRVRFAVECETHCGFSHHLDRGRREIAVEEWLSQNVSKARDE